MNEEIGWISLIDLTPWQLNCLSEYIIEYNSREYKNRMIYVAKIRINDINLIDEIIDREGIISVKNKDVKNG